MLFIEGSFQRFCNGCQCCHVISIHVAILQEGRCSDTALLGLSRTEEFLGREISCIMSVTVFCLCGYYTNNLFTVLWRVPFPVPHRGVRAVRADAGRNGGDSDCHSWWLVSGWDYRRLLHSSNIQLFHQGVIPWWVSTGFQAIHALLLLCKFPWVSWKEACWVDVYLFSVLGWSKVLRYKVAGRAFDFRWCLWNFQLHNPSGRTMALGSTHPLTEMSTWW